MNVQNSDLQHLLTLALMAKDPAKVRKAVQAGANVNQPLTGPHLECWTALEYVFEYIMPSDLSYYPDRNPEIAERDFKVAEEIFLIMLEESLSVSTRDLFFLTICDNFLSRFNHTNPVFDDVKAQILISYIHDSHVTDDPRYAYNISYPAIFSESICSPVIDEDEARRHLMDSIGRVLDRAKERLDNPKTDKEKYLHNHCQEFVDSWFVRNAPRDPNSLPKPSVYQKGQAQKMENRLLTGFGVPVREGSNETLTDLFVAGVVGQNLTLVEFKSEKPEDSEPGGAEPS